MLPNLLLLTANTKWQCDVKYIGSKGGQSLQNRKIPFPKLLFNLFYVLFYRKLIKYYLIPWWICQWGSFLDVLICYKGYVTNMGLWCSGESVLSLIRGLRFESWKWKKSCWKRHFQNGPCHTQFEFSWGSMNSRHWVRNQKEKKRLEGEIWSVWKLKIDQLDWKPKDKI